MASAPSRPPADRDRPADAPASAAARLAAAPLGRALLLGVPAATAVVLVLHPPDPPPRHVVEQLADVTTRWLAVHVALLVALPLLGLWLWLALAAVENRAAWVARFFVLPFVAFYAAFDALVGIGTGVLVRETVALREAGQAGPAEGLVETWWQVPAPVWVFSTLGPLSWLFAAGAAALAHFRAGSGLLVVGGLALAAPLFAFHHPGIPGGLAMLALLAAAVGLRAKRPANGGASVRAR